MTKMCNGQDVLQELTKEENTLAFIKSLVGIKQWNNVIKLLLISAHGTTRVWLSIAVFSSVLLGEGGS